MYFQSDKAVEEKQLFALKGPNEFCPSSPVCFKMFWMTKEILSFDVSILDISSNEVVFESEIQANQNSSCALKKKRKNKMKQKQFKKEDVMCSIICADDNADLISNAEYEIGATAKIGSMNSVKDPENESTLIRYQNLNPPLKFKIADDSTKYILSIKKRPKSFNVTSDNKLKLKAKIKSCEEKSMDGTNSLAKNEKEKDLSGKNGSRNKPASDDNLKGRKEKPNKNDMQGKNKRNKNGKTGNKTNKKDKSKNDRRNKERSSKKKNERNKKGDKENSNESGKPNNRRKKNNMSKKFKV